MLVVGFPTGALQANCYLLAAGEGEACVVVDPGQDAVEPIMEAVREHRLSPVAVLLTHGHFDHSFSVTPVCDGNDVPAWIHPADRAMLSDPLKGVSAETAAFFGGRLEMREPSEVRELADGVTLDLAGLRLLVDHTPGHTGGSVMFRAGTEEGGRLVLSGDPCSPARSAAPYFFRRRPLGDAGLVAGQGVDPARRHRGAARPRRLQHHRTRARRQPVPAGPRRPSLRAATGDVRRARAHPA
ncbi:hydroxyacylglutathione hydrolase [Kutzneria sp. 744]|nr:hydroxyacylglutathione hydrolase [Kutzneria sp. 744]